LINFHTENLDKVIYTRLIRWYVYDMFNDTLDFGDFFFKWTIDVYPSSMAPNDPFFDGKEGVGGVTGMYKMKLYLEDKKTNILRDIFRRVLRQNLLVITHELAHAILLHKGLKHKVKLRNNDWSGHKKGTKLNFSTAEVHDRHVEGKFKKMNVWVRNGWTWVRLRGLSTIDIDDLV
jgi:hypothetical protein